MKTSNANDYNDEIKNYFANIKGFKPLTKQEEKLLFIDMKNGDINARNKILEANLKYVVNMAKKYKGHGIPFEDLISEGNLGLMKAIDKFDYKNNDIKFYSYGKWWIKATIQEFIKKRNMSDTNELSEDDMYPSSINESGDERMNMFDDTQERENLEKDKIQLIKKLMKILTDEERLILGYYYGLTTENGKELTLDVIGKKINLSSERVRQKKENALRKLRCFALLKNEI